MSVCANGYFLLSTSCAELLFLLLTSSPFCSIIVDNIYFSVWHKIKWKLLKWRVFYPDEWIVRIFCIWIELVEFDWSLGLVFGIYLPYPKVYSNFYLSLYQCTILPFSSTKSTIFRGTWGIFTYPSPSIHQKYSKVGPRVGFVGYPRVGWVW